MKIYKKTAFILLSLVCGILTAYSRQPQRPNILFCIADDASWQHMSAYGKTTWVKTPAFDRVAKEGLLFNNAYTPNAKCSPSRACILTGRNPWQLEEAGNHHPFFPAKFTTVVEALAKNGYFTGFTGKGWGPGNPGKYADGTPRLLAGKEYNALKTQRPTREINAKDYAANFESFLKAQPAGQPFFFWFGSHEPHRSYEPGAGISKGGKKLSDIREVPPFWIDNETIRKDMLDYAFELEYFDKELGEILRVLDKSGELDNTLIVVTSDNGMPFPRVKGHVYEYDNHLPLAMMWKGQIKNPGRRVEDMVSFIDLAPTFLALAGVGYEQSGMQPVQGRSLLDFLYGKSSNGAGVSRNYVLLGRERQDVGRPHDEGYPVRAIVKGDYIYSKNYEPSRWPSGNPETGYMDTDGSPAKTAILAANRLKQYTDIWQLCFGMKPPEELYNFRKDPYSLHNLATDPAYGPLKKDLEKEMESTLKEQQDPRMFGNGKLFDDYPYSEDRVRNFYERYMNGEKIKTGWIELTDFESTGYNHP